MATKRPPSFADIVAQAKVVCQETEFEKRKRQRTRSRKTSVPSSSGSASAPASTTMETVPPPAIGPSTFKFSVRKKHQSCGQLDMGHSMTTFRIPPPSAAYASTSTPTNALPSVPFTFSVPLSTSKSLVNSPTAHPTTVSIQQTYPYISYPPPMKTTSYTIKDNQESPPFGQQNPLIVMAMIPATDAAKSSVNDHILQVSDESSPPTPASESHGGRSRELSTGPNSNTFSKLTRSNRIELALTLLQDGGIDLASFLADLLDPTKTEFASCRDTLYDDDQHLLRILSMVKAHPKGKRQLEEWLSAQVESTPL